MPAPVLISRRESGLDQAKSPMLHSALSTSLSRSFGLNSPFSLSALSSSLTHLSSSPGFSAMGMSLGRSFEERPKLEAQFFRNFTCCGLDLQDLHGLLEHFEECHVALDDDQAGHGNATNAAGGNPASGMEVDDGASEGTISGPPSPRMNAHGAAQRQFEAKKSALSAFEMPESPATNTIQLDPSMELDMEMDDEESDTPYNPLPPASVPTSTASAHAFQPTTMSAFENTLPLQGSAAKKKFSTAMNAHSIGRPLGGMGGVPLGLDALQASRGGASGYSTPDASIPGTPIMEEMPGRGVDGFFSVPASASTQPGATVGLAPSLLFPNTPTGSPPEDDHGSASSQHGGNDSSTSGSVTDHAGATIGAGGSSLGSNHGSHHPSPSRHDYPNDAKEAQTALLAAALGQNSVAALPTAMHPLGTGVQISPSGRPYTPPSEKPFKCSVPGCDKSYKQQNGLKYHRLHGHCNAGSSAESSEGKGEGKPYVCHVASCGKRYKNMNGLRYHYQHSGAHGALGLQMLAQGCHPPPQFPPGHKRASGQYHQGHASAQAAGHSAPNSRSASPAPSYSRGVSPVAAPILSTSGMQLPVGMSATTRASASYYE